MSKNIAKALAALDVGLQSSTEMGYGTDVVPDKCARCQRNRPGPEGADLCFLCRAFLLGDSEDDPKRPRPRWLDDLHEAVTSATATFTPSDVHEVRVSRLDADGALVGPSVGLHHIGPLVLDPRGDWFDCEVSVDFTNAMRRVGQTLAVDSGVLAASFAALCPGASELMAHAEAEERRQAAQALVDVLSVAAREALDVITSFATSAALGLSQAVGDVFAWLQESGLFQVVDEPEPPKVRRVRQARERELDMLDRHRRSHRRTNRWGPPPGRASW